MYFPGFKDRQFVLIIVSRDPWEILRNFNLPDDLFILSNMEGLKKHKGDIEIVFVADKNMYLNKTSELEVLVAPPVYNNVPPELIEKLGTGLLRASMSEDDPSIRIQGDPFGIQPIYYTSTSSGTIMATRLEWLNRLTSKIFELPANYKLTMSLFSFYKHAVEQNQNSEKIGTIERTINEQLSIIGHLNKETYFFYTGSRFSQFLLDKILTYENEYERLKILNMTNNSNDHIKKLSDQGVDEVIHISEIGPPPSESKLNSKCEGTDISNRALLDAIYNLSERNKPSIIILPLIDFIKNEDEPIIASINKKHIYKIFRAIFKCAWPNAVIDPFLNRNILSFPLRKLWHI